MADVAEMAEFKLPVDCHFNSSIAVFLGLPEALVLSRIHWSVKTHKRENEERFFIADRWCMCETALGFAKLFPFITPRTIQRAVKNLRDQNLITVFEGKAKGSRINIYSLNENEITTKFHELANSEITTKCRNEDDKMSQTITTKCRNEDDKMSQTFSIQSPLEINQNKGEGDARACEENPPPIFLNSENQDGIGKTDKPPEAGQCLSLEANAHKARWLGRCAKLARTRHFSDPEMDAEIIKMARFYSYPELDRILDYLEISTSKAAKEFITPFDHSKKFFDQGTLIEVAFIEATKSPEGRAIEEKKKTETREAEKKRLEKEAQIKKESETHKKREEGWLKKGALSVAK